jgi:hypothetical protein
MSSANAAESTSETPKRVRHSFDKVLGRLNSKWDLDLPTTHGNQDTALKQMDATTNLAKRCSSSIRYLCYRDCQLERVVSDFEEDVPRLCSEWVWKPSQEKGTLPKLPLAKSFISSRPEITNKHRHSLLLRLHSLLREEVLLALASEDYQRTSLKQDSDASDPVRLESITVEARTTRSRAQIGVGRTVAGSVLHGARASTTAQSGGPVKRKSSGQEKVGIEQHSIVQLLFEPGS